MGNQARLSIIITGKNTDKTGIMTDDEADDLKEAFERQYGGQNIGSPAIYGREMDVHELSIKPKDLEIGTLRHVPEQRICAAFGVSAAVVGLGTGEKSSTYNNGETHDRQAFEQNLIPFWKLLEEAFNEELLPDFGENVNNLVVEFVYDHITALQESLDSKAKQAEAALEAGGITLNEYRALIDQPALPEGELLMLPANAIVINPSELTNYTVDARLAFAAAAKLKTAEKPAEVAVAEVK